VRVEWNALDGLEAAFPSEGALMLRAAEVSNIAQLNDLASGTANPVVFFLGVFIEREAANGLICALFALSRKRMITSLVNSAADSSGGREEIGVDVAIPVFRQRRTRKARNC